MTNQPAPPPADSERIVHLEALAQLVHRFVEQARAIDAQYAPVYTDMARELRALGYTVRADIPQSSIASDAEPTELASP
jgi:hypothetical protein